MSASILDEVKHMLGIQAEDREFDGDIMIYINTAFSTLTQLGVGPLIGYQVLTKDNTWAEFFTDARLNSVKSYVFLKVKMLHAPPDTGFVLSAMERQIQEMEYRLNVVAEYG